jgi:hypothetical protein
VDDVGPEGLDLCAQLWDELRLDVATTPNDVRLDSRGPHLVDKAHAITNAEHRHLRLDATGMELWKQCEEVALGPADALDALDVEDPHADYRLTVIRRLVVNPLTSSTVTLNVLVPRWTGTADAVQSVCHL